ncbi:hypothetical protein HHI36_015354 [Cryptolaemus montrouzieri]|uniref:Uncharacterized protein n=1 Tax=Cryptolaemus montrouzieri TaxID=559131 RepID=A0ABD2N5W2_9CUCU
MDSKNVRSSFGKSCTKHFYDYCEHSSIQGLSYLAKDSGPRDKLWWIIVFTMCCAVTICPESKISTKCLNYTKILRARKLGKLIGTSFTENKYFDYMSLLCNAENHGSSMQLTNRSISEMFNETSSNSDDRYPLDFGISDYADFLYDCAAVTIDDATCQWMGTNMPCREVMTPIVTDEGLCYTFNMFDIKDIYRDVNRMKTFRRLRNPTWDPDWGYPKNDVLEHAYPRQAFLNGAKNAFVAVFFTKKDQLNYGCNHFSLQGIRVSLHIATRIPRPSQVFFSVGLDRLTTAAVIPSLTSVTENILDYDPHDRNCFFSKERKLKYFAIYSQGNCNLECWTNFTLQACNCVSYYMPRDNQTRLCTLQETKCLEQARVDYPEAVLSDRLWRQKKRKGGSKKIHLNCDCLPVCLDIVYNTELATGEWDFNNPDEAAYDDSRNITDLYYASGVKIFFKDNYFLPTSKDELYGTIDVISDCGGVLGLFIGFSLFSVGELIYFFSIRLIENYRHSGHWAG